MDVLVWNCFCRGYSICENIVSYVPAQLDIMARDCSSMMTSIERRSSPTAYIILGPINGGQVGIEQNKGSIRCSRSRVTQQSGLSAADQKRDHKVHKPSATDSQQTMLQN